MPVHFKATTYQFWDYCKSDELLPYIHLRTTAAVLCDSLWTVNQVVNQDVRELVHVRRLKRALRGDFESSFNSLDLRARCRPATCP